MHDKNPDPSNSLVEDLARVVAAEGELVWLEPEQSPSCAGCAAMAGCSAKDLGSLSRRLAARRFPLPQLSAEPRLRVGERVVVGVRPPALVSGSAVAYLVPLLAMFAAGFAAQNVWARDGFTLLACVAGLAAGVGVAHLLAARLAARGALAFRYLRRADPAWGCIPAGGTPS